MLENINDIENKGSEINLNLKIPQEETDSSFTFKKLVLTIYNAKKTFLIWSCIGLVLGVIAGGLVYVFSSRSEPEPVAAPAAEVSVSLIFNNSTLSEHIIPGENTYYERLFHISDIWGAALKTIGRSDIAVADAMVNVTVFNINYLKSIDELSHILTNLPIGIPTNVYPVLAEHFITNYSDIRNNSYLLTISADSDVFINTEEKEAFLLAFCDEIKNYTDDTMLITTPHISAVIPVDDSIGGFSLVLLITAVFAICIAAGVIMAFIITAVKKYIPINE